MNARPRTAFLTGITGQDGSYLSELLLSKGYSVHGLVRRVSSSSPDERLWRLSHILPNIHLHSGSLESYPSIFQAIQRVQPDECYHLAGQSFVTYSFEDEFSTLNTNTRGTHHILAALKEAAPACKFFFAGSSEMFGKPQESPQGETHPFHPRSAYGVSKVTGFDLTRMYRESHGLFACSGILFNHESPRRGAEFVSRKITRSAARIRLGLQTELVLGNLDARRDWGHARDYVVAMWLMLNQSVPDDYVLASGATHSVEEFCQMAFERLDLRWQDFVRVAPEFCRPPEPVQLVGDTSKAWAKLRWRPSTPFSALVAEMVDSDLGCSRQAQGGSVCP